jgi:hypothetical protein
VLLLNERSFSLSISSTKSPDSMVIPKVKEGGKTMRRDSRIMRKTQ